MTDFNIGSVGSSVLGIAGMGIGLGLLAHTASNISRMTDRMYEPAPRSRPVHRSAPRTRSRSISYRPRTRTRTSIRYQPKFYNPWY